MLKYKKVTSTIGALPAGQWFRMPVGDKRFMKLKLTELLRKLIPGGGDVPVTPVVTNEGSIDFLRLDEQVVKCKAPVFVDE